MARTSPAAICVLAVSCCAVLRCSTAFLPGRAQAVPRSDVALATAAGAAAVAGIPDAAEAFSFQGKEYFDIWFGIEPLAWAVAGFTVVAYGAILKNTALKYNKPVGKKPLKVGNFLGKDKENPEVEDYRTA
eukprot:TRINITY_DN4253_c0_g1_i2.p2 TRINITY_DN4253_c0_g1~~TRINITY_DN4253_c0_g1_i2.p2  ORF type:complete len:150 (+),score=39.50 TRINITY_DN4253_c0_g1_i2:58-450(+)